MADVQGGSHRCRACEATWTAAAESVTDDPVQCPNCGSTEVSSLDPYATPYPHQPNPEMLHLQYLTPQPPPAPGTMVRMGPYMPLPRQRSSSARWAEDPAGRNQWRWWAGSVWTDYVANDGVTSSDPLP